jgi:hypothetical protein
MQRPVVTLRCASRQAAANLIRPTFRAFIAILNPLPRSDSIFSTGTLVSVKKTWRVDEARMPSLCSSSFIEMPLSGSFSTMKPVMFLSSPILAKTMNNEQNPALEIHIFCPVIE